MTAQEQQMLKGLADRVDQTQLADKDPEAEQFLQSNLGKNPDALYILAQTVLVTQYAMEQAQRQMADAKDQISQLQQQLAQAQQQQPQKHTSFLGGLLGGHDDRPAPPPPPTQPQSQYQPVQNYQQPQYAGQAYPVAPPQYGSPVYVEQPGFGGQQQSGGFLRGAMQTAAGVAAGAVAFEGFESLMHGFGGGGYGYERGGGYGLGGGGFNQPTEVVNNYYDDNRGGGGGSTFGERLSNDIEDRRDEHNGGQQFGDTGNSTADVGMDDDSSATSDFGDTGSDFADTSSDSDSGSDFGSDSN